MDWRIEDGKFRKPKEIIPPPSVNEIIKNREFWKKR